MTRYMTAISRKFHDAMKTENKTPIHNIMKKQTILLLFLVLSCYSFSAMARDTTKNDILMGKHAGDILVGKHAKLKLYVDPEFGEYVLQNIQNKDSLQFLTVWEYELISDWDVPREVKKQITQIVGSCLTPEERAIYKKEDSQNLIVMCRLEKDKIIEVAFHFNGLEEYEDGDPMFEDEHEKTKMLWSLSADRFHEIEKAIIDKLDLRRLLLDEGSYVGFAVLGGYLQD